MKHILQSAVLFGFALSLMAADLAEAQFFPHNDSTYAFVATTNAFGRIQTYDGEDGRWDSFDDKVIDRFYQMVGFDSNYVWNPNDDPDLNLIDTVYYAGEDDVMYFRELLMDNSFRANPPFDIEVHTMVRLFKDELYGLVRFGVVRQDERDFKLTALLRAKIFEEWGGETMEWDAGTERLYIFNNNAAIGIQALTTDPVGVVLMDFDEYDSTEPPRDNARDFARWDIMVEEDFPAGSINAGPDGGWAFMNFGDVSNIATGDTAYVWLAFTHGPDLDEVDDRLDAALAKAEDIGIIGDPVSVGPEGPEAPVRIALEQNYPNPFNPTTNIRFDVAEAGQVSLGVYDMLGRQVALLVNENLSAGTHTVSFDATNLSSGVYLYRLQAGGQTLTRSMTLMK
ncbi:Por secretion system C-terminal sorting domain-containing protein [Cyclonatronum proteinivorum]|uniref:Por secretion system C-terminal sorting domain-containing protein n=1 Tax=Cyclonatronum proteinivorum TaxID=1457365 RepID=A0A345ULP6_9BACT|nr:T9SS type A sorting domain-containing protein [Cyclonatronum proteinivorum]AXJ01398.1 Por secretion system C-terminal sorting domain-containing protein [Cyclonatronum proteinivorum]